MAKKELLSTNWFKVFQNDRGFIFGQRKNKNSIAVLLVKKVEDDYWFMVHYQPLIEVKENDEDGTAYPCCITGTCEENEGVYQTAIHEVKEEAGIELIANQDLPLITYDYVATTQMNEVVKIFVFDVTNKEQSNPQTDGSYYESISYNIWIPRKNFEKLIMENITLSCLPIAYLIFNNYMRNHNEN